MCLNERQSPEPRFGAHFSGALPGFGAGSFAARFAARGPCLLCLLRHPVLLQHPRAAPTDGLHECFLPCHFWLACVLLRVAGRGEISCDPAVLLLVVLLFPFCLAALLALPTPKGGLSGAPP